MSAKGLDHETIRQNAAKAFVKDVFGQDLKSQLGGILRPLFERIKAQREAEEKKTE